MKQRHLSPTTWHWSTWAIPSFAFSGSGFVYSMLHFHHPTHEQTAILNVLLGLSYFFLGLPKLIQGAQARQTGHDRFFGYWCLGLVVLFAYVAGDNLNWW